MKINMKEELRKVVIKEYVACDGKVFATEQACLDHEESLKDSLKVRRLADEWDMPFDELMSQMHTASADEIREYGV